MGFDFFIIFHVLYFTGYVSLIQNCHSICLRKFAQAESLLSDIDGRAAT